MGKVYTRFQTKKGPKTTPFGEAHDMAYPQGFSLKFFKGKALGTRLTFAENARSLPLSPPLESHGGTVGLHANIDRCRNAQQLNIHQ